MTDAEEICCAAVSDGTRVARGGNHDNARAAWMQAYSSRNIGACTSGFVTSTGRFVGRGEAAKIAFAAGQIREPVAELYSEDLCDQLNMLHHARAQDARKART